MKSVPDSKWPIYITSSRTTPGRQAKEDFCYIEIESIPEATYVCTALQKMSLMLPNEDMTIKTDLETVATRLPP
jgi:hypothetical protein